MSIPKHQSVSRDILAAGDSRTSLYVHRAKARLTTRRPGFTLTELLVAVAVLVGILLAVGKIFSTTSRVTSVGTATTDVMQEIAAIDRQIREDVGRLSYDGVFAIRCVALRNDLYPGLLLNPSLPADAYIRSDQLIFFTRGPQSVQTFRVGQSGSHSGQGIQTRVYYGHAFQFADAGEPVNIQGPVAQAHDADQIVFPWAHSAFSGPVATIRTHFASSAADTFITGSASAARLAVPDVRKWLLVRQPVVLVDDDTGPRDSDSKYTYLSEVLSAPSIFLEDPELGLTPHILQGRVDAAASQLDDVRRLIRFDPSGAPRDWHNPTGSTPDQYSMISSQLLYYPRAERYGPSMHRVDQALTNNVLGSAVSSVKIDWTYADGVGEIRDRYGTVIIPGLTHNAPSAQPWFGMPDPEALLASGEIQPDLRRGVGAYGDPQFQGDMDYAPAETVFPENIEKLDTFGAQGFDEVMTYEAIFGYNQDQPLNSAGLPHVDMGYTPWPTAIRVTLTVHDPSTTLENGREVQFVIDLPRRR